MGFISIVIQSAGDVTLTHTHSCRRPAPRPPHSRTHSRPRRVARAVAARHTVPAPGGAAVSGRLRTSQATAKLGRTSPVYVPQVRFRVHALGPVVEPERRPPHIKCVQVGRRPSAQ